MDHCTIKFIKPNKLCNYFGQFSVEKHSSLGFNVIFQLCNVGDLLNFSELSFLMSKMEI